jgi:dTDP-4-amino-4,6-dideoxygalactose transaminase
MTPRPSRRTFLAATTAVAGALPAVGAAPRREALALDGGSKAVTVPDRELDRLTRWPRYGEAEKAALRRLIDSNSYYPELARFEAEWQSYTGAAFVKVHCNCSSALTSMYFALDLEPGSEVMVPSYTFFSTCLAMRFFGLVPIFVDIDPKTACFDLEDARRKLTPRTKALVAMHSWGLPCELDHIADFCREKGLILLEDAAHAHGATMQGRAVGTWGAIGATSFQATKVLPGIEGGMGMYQSRDYYERAAAFGHYEAPATFAEDSPVRAYAGTGFGQKYRMHPFAAAVLRTQLATLDDRNAIARKNVAALNSRLSALEGLAEPRCRPDQHRVYYYANMLLLDEAKAGMTRDALVKALQAEGVRATTWDYPEQHRLKIYAEPRWWHHAPTIPERMPGDERVNRSHLFLPLLYGEAGEVIDQYVRAFEKVWANRAAAARAAT